MAVTTVSLLVAGMPLLASQANAAVRNPDQPRLALDSKGNPVICWERGSSQIWFSKLDQNGNFAIGRTRANPGPYESAVLPKVVLDPKNNIHLFYVGFSHGNGESDHNIHYIKFGPEGKSLLNNRILGETGYASSSVSSGTYNVVASPSGELHLMWGAKENNTGGARYMKLDSAGKVLVNEFVQGLFGPGIGFGNENIVFSMDIDSKNNLHLVRVGDYKIFNTTTLNYTRSNWSSGGDFVKVDRHDTVHIRYWAGYVNIDSNGTLVQMGGTSLVTGYQTMKVNDEYLYMDTDGAIDSSGNLHMVQVESEREEQGREVVYYYTITYSKVQIATHATLIDSKVIDSDRLPEGLTPEQLLTVTVLIVVPIVILLQVYLYRRRKRKARNIPQWPVQGEVQGNRVR